MIDEMRHMRQERDQALQRARAAEHRVTELELEVMKLRERLSVFRGVSL